MKYTVKINNLPKTYLPYIVCRVVDGKLWFFSSWADEEYAHTLAVDLDGIVVYAEEEELA